MSAMAIKMRSNENLDAVCCNCGDARNEVLNMFDLCIGGTIVTVCDVCNEQILTKTLKAECMKNERVKSGHDMTIIRKRGQAAYGERRAARIAAGTASENLTYQPHTTSYKTIQGKGSRNGKKRT